MNIHLQYHKLFEYILQEANKERFFKTLWNTFAEPDDTIYTNNITYDELLNFVNSDDPILKNRFEKEHLNWQSNKDEPFDKWVAIIESYLERNIKKQEKNKGKKIFNSKTFKGMAQAAGYKVAETGTESLSNAAFAHLSDLENDKYDFYVPLSWQACVFCDSVQAGGQGARWCIGYEKDDSHWVSYTRNGDIFILAINKMELEKRSNIPQNKLKYMIRITYDIDEVGAWPQDDDANAVIPAHVFKLEFDRTAEEMLFSLEPVLDEDTVYRKFYNEDLYNPDYTPQQAKLDGVPYSKIHMPWYSLIIKIRELYYNKDFIIENSSEVNVKHFNLLDKIHNDKLTIDFEGLDEIDEKTLKANKFYAVDNGAFYVSKLTDWIKQFKITKHIAVQIIGLNINKVVWDPKAVIDFEFHKCKMAEFVFKDEFAIPFVTLDKCEVGNLSWPVSSIDFNNYNWKIFFNDTEPESETYLEDTEI